MIEFFKLKSLYKQLYDHFGNYEQATLWFRTKNPHFVGIAPQELLRLRGVGKVKQLVDSLLEGF